MFHHSPLLKGRLDKHLVNPPPPEGDSKVLHQGMSVNMLNYLQLITQEGAAVDAPWLSKLTRQQLRKVVSAQSSRVAVMENSLKMEVDCKLESLVGKK